MEDSPSGLWRTLGKRVGCKPSGVRIPYPPPKCLQTKTRDARALLHSYPLLQLLPEQRVFAKRLSIMVWQIIWTMFLLSGKQGGD